MKYTAIDFLYYNFKLIQRLFMGIWSQLAEYLYIKKRDKNDERTQWMKYMHGMNRISLLMFLVAIVVIIAKMFVIPLFKH